MGSSPPSSPRANATEAARLRLQRDPDIKSEAAAMSQYLRNPSASPAPLPAGDQLDFVPLGFKPGQGGHRPSQGTLALLEEVGGVEGLRQFTTRFYERAFEDPHLDQFLREHNDPHGERFANWICEKFGGGNPWTRERSTRKVCPFQSHGHQLQTPHDRSSAHFAAWHSPKRAPGTFGDHFKLDDCRVWMRLHFWAMRESGVYERSPAFAEYYIKFLGHFVSIYEGSATQFARESARWSAHPENIQAYLENGHQMTDVLGLSLSQACKQLPEEERQGSWPYGH